jgi:hypothetical protein
MKSPSVLSKSLKVLFTVIEAGGALLCLMGIFSIAMSFCNLDHLPVLAKTKCGLVDVRTEIDASTLQLKTPAIAPGKIRFDGTLYVLLNPTYARDFVKSLGRPRGFAMLSGGMLVWAIADLFRRMFRSVERREVFTATNVRRMRWIAGLIILGRISQSLMLWWQAKAEVAFAHSNLATEGVSYHPSFGVGDWISVTHSIIVGLLVLALAEVFNQGLLLKQDNELTV